MVDLLLLKDRGIDYEGLRKLLAPDDEKISTTTQPKDAPKTKTEKIARLKALIRSRISAGRDQNISNYKQIHAIDLAWETPRRQISTTLLNSLMDKSPGPNINTTLEAWGFDLSQVLVEVPDPKVPGKTTKAVSAPAFAQVMVPIVKAYTSIRVAKLMNDRRRWPFMKYEPAISTAMTRMQCEVLTARVEMMNQHYDYWQVVHQATLQMCLYGSCLIFPKEEWHEVCHETDKDDKFARKAQWEDKDYKEGSGSEKKYRYERVEKEGIRYKTPHPTRVFSDEAHPPSSFNTDSGCEYAGFWEVVRYRDIRNNPKFYNKDKVSIGSTDWWARPTTNLFFKTVYNSCTIVPPVIPQNDEADRETRIADNYYTHEMEDSSVAITNYFQKLVPSEFGLGDYDYPVWFRFVVASDDTILYASPLPYPPVDYLGYDADELRASCANSSLALECLPFQDQVSNLLTQYLLSVRQNLTNVTFYDTTIVKSPLAEKLKGIGRNRLAEFNLVGLDFKKNMALQTDIAKSFQSFRFPPLDTNGIIQAIKLQLDLLERVLVMSSQEVAQAATHEQTREEIRHIGSSTSTRLTATGIPIDQAIEAMKRQLYVGLMSYGEDELWAQVPLDRELTTDMKTTLTLLGFTFEEPNDAGIVKSKRLTVRVKKQALMIENFASSREGEDRINNTEAGMAMLQTMVGLMSSPLYPVIGPDQFLTLINLSAQLMGYPREFKLQNMGEWNQDNMAQMQQAFQQLQQSMRQEVQQGITPIMDAVQKNTQSIEQTREQTDKAFEDQDHKIKDLDQKTSSKDKDIARDTKDVEAMLNRLVKMMESAQKLPTSTQIVAPNAEITLSPDSGNGIRKGSQITAVVTAA